MISLTKPENSQLKEIVLPKIAVHALIFKELWIMIKMRISRPLYGLVALDMIILNYLMNITITVSGALRRKKM